MGSKTSPISFRLDADVKAAIDKAAKDDERSVSSLVAIILRGWLKEQGYLPK